MIFEMYEVALKIKYSFDIASITMNLVIGKIYSKRYIYEYNKSVFFYLLEEKLCVMFC